MNCKDCICYDILCKDTLQDDELQLCDHFKNKADFVEVVRCKDCTHYKARGTVIELNNKGFGNCSQAREFWDDEPKEVYEDDFCSCGKRVQK